MQKKHRSFLEIFRSELEAKREAAGKKRHFAEYRPDQEALEKFGYDLNDPGFVASQTAGRYGDRIFKNLSPDDLRRRYALYLARKNRTWRNELRDVWSMVCEITDELFNWIKERVAYLIVNCFTVLKITLLALPVMVFLLVLWSASIVTIPLRQSRDGNPPEF